MALHAFVMELASFAIVTQNGPGLQPLYREVYSVFQGMVVIDQRRAFIVIGSN